MPERTFPHVELVDLEDRPWHTGSLGRRRFVVFCFASW